MCGIAGFCNGTFDWRKNIEKMNERMYHRGPDASGVWASEDRQVVLGHRRLSIIDLSPGGSQPMESRNGRYVIAYNGEIYNYPVIRDRLIHEKKVTAFKGTSDTEALLEAVSSYGLEETLKMSKGMFALALYDKKEKTLFLARDRVVSVCIGTGGNRLCGWFSGSRSYRYSGCLFPLWLYSRALFHLSGNL